MVTIQPSALLSRRSPGYAFATDDGATILLRPEVVPAASKGDEAALHVIVHEVMHVVLHMAELRARGKESDGGRDIEHEANSVADLICAATRAW